MALKIDRKRKKNASQQLSTGSLNRFMRTFQRISGGVVMFWLLPGRRFVFWAVAG